MCVIVFRCCFQKFGLLDLLAAWKFRHECDVTVGRGFRVPNCDTSKTENQLPLLLSKAPTSYEKWLSKLTMGLFIHTLIPTDDALAA